MGAIEDLQQVVSLQSYLNQRLQDLDPVKYTDERLRILSLNDKIYAVEQLDGGSATPPSYLTGGYGSLPESNIDLAIGAGGISPNVASLAWGDNTGEQLIFGTNVGDTFTPRFYFTDEGKLGIGGVPSGLFQVNAAFRVNSDGSLWMHRDTGSIGFAVGLDSAQPRAKIATSVANDLVFSTGAVVEAMRIMGGGGWVGIGTNNPDRALHVKKSDAGVYTQVESTAGSNAQAGVIVKNPGRAWSFLVNGATAGDPLNIFDNTAGANRVSIDSNGNVTAETGDVSVGTVGKGLTIRSPNGTKYRVKVSDAGALSTEAA